MGLSDPKVVNISGVARPSKRMKHLARTVHGERFERNLGAMLNDAIAIEALAGCLDRAMTKAVNGSGNLDLKLMAAELLGELKRNQR